MKQTRTKQIKQETKSIYLSRLLPSLIKVKKKLPAKRENPSFLSYKLFPLVLEL